MAKCHEPGSSWRVLVQLPGRFKRLSELEQRSSIVVAQVCELALDSRQFDFSVFDELVVDNWLHLEQMDKRWWFLQVGDYRINVKVGPDGKAAEVLIEHEPGE